jgi:hypothetical protein
MKITAIALTAAFVVSPAYAACRSTGPGFIHCDNGSTYLNNGRRTVQLEGPPIIMVPSLGIAVEGRPALSSGDGSDRLPTRQ